MKPTVEYTEDKIYINDGVGTYSITRRNDDMDNMEVQATLDMIERDRFYNSPNFVDDFNKNLETAILATRHGGTGARACRDTLLSLYNGSAYKANLSDWYSLDSKNRAALLFILEHQTSCNRKDIDLYLPQYQADFKRMKEEVLTNEQAHKAKISINS